MDLATLRNRVASKIGLSSTAELALIDGWLNEAVEQYLVDTKARVREAQLALTAGVSDYTLPVEVLAFAGIWVNDAEIYQIGTSEMIVRRRTGASGRVAYYELLGLDLLRLSPPPATGDQLHMLYVPAPTPMTLDADTPTTSGVPTYDHPALEEYASWKAADWDDDTSSKIGDSYHQNWLQAVARAKARRNRLGGGWGPARPGRRQFVPTSPGVDTGA